MGKPVKQEAKQLSIQQEQEAEREVAILRNTGLALVGLLLLVLPAAGQVKVGELSTDLNGTLSAGYTGDFGNLIQSDHSLAFGGAATLSGFYYNPNFVQFTVSPYYNQGRNNSTSGSFSDASGVNLSSNIFGGSRFPGSISYAKAYNSEGSFAVPGVANYTTHGNSDTFSVAWGALIPDWPSLFASFQMGSNHYSIYGSQDNGSTDNKNFNLRSSYMLRGFSLSGYFSDGDAHTEVPQVLSGSSTSETSTSNDRNYGFAVGHSLPFHGGFSGNFNSSYVDSNYADTSYHGTIDTYTATASFQLTNKLHTSITADYSDNLTGSLYQAIEASGGLVTPPEQGQSSHSSDVAVAASYSILPNLQGQANADHRQQSFLGESFSSNSYGGGLTYWRLLFGGNFNAALSLSDNTVSTSSANTLGFTGTLGYNKRLSSGWVFGTFFNYSQNVQTLLITYVSSFYGYGGNVRKRWGKFGWSSSAVFNKTGLTEQAGTASKSESFSTSLSYSHFANFNASYSKSNGNGIESGAGLVATPTPQPIPNPNDLIVYAGKSYSFGFSSAPVRRMTLSAAWAKSISNTDVLRIPSENNTNQINTLIQYQFRKMYFTGGYSRLVQGFSALQTPAEHVNSYYVGISRWFNFF